MKLHFRSYMYNFKKKFCIHDISIHTNFHQNRSINECARMILVLYVLDNFVCVFKMLTFLKSFFLDQALNK